MKGGIEIHLIASSLIIPTTTAPLYVQIYYNTRSIIIDISRSKMMIKLTAFFPSILLLVLINISFQANAKDYCVADHSLPTNPSGYACKNPDKVTADDFFYTGLATPGNTSNFFNSKLTPAYSVQLPGLNGLGLGMGRVDLGPGGVVPIHAHPGTAELLVGIEGKICSGFLSSNNVAYTRVLEKGHIAAFPPGVLNWVYNCADGQGERSSAYAIFNNPTPSVQVFDYSVFGSDLPSQVVEKTTFLDADQVTKLKKLFGGSE